MAPRNVLLPLVVVFGLLAQPVVAQQEIKLGHAGTPGSIIDRSAQEFARRVNERVGGEATVVVYGSGQLGTDALLMAKLKLGTVDLALPGAVLSTQVPQFGLFDLPYLVRDREHVARMRDRIVKPLLAPLAAERGYRILAMWENGFRHITNNRRPVVTPQDVQGIKLRVPEGAWRVKAFQAMGANPTPLAFTEVYLALQTGVIDGQENPFAVIYSARLYEVQKYLSLTGHQYSSVFLIAGASWPRLDARVQTAVMEVAAEIEPVSLKMGADAEAELLDRLKAAGMRVNEVNKDAFVKASGAVYRAFAAEVPQGQELIDAALALAEAALLQEQAAQALR